MPQQVPMEEVAVGSCLVLPVEIETEILLRLPVESLLRFKCVQKSWCFLVQRPTFVAMYLTRRFGKNNDGILFSTSSDKSLFYKSFKRGNSNPDDAVEFLKPDRGKVRYIIGSSNGLVCLANFSYWNASVHDSYSIYILNPSTRKLIVVPRPYFYRYNNVETEAAANHAFGFGYCPEINDYKLVKVSQYLFNWASGGWVEIYTLSSNSWRMITTANAGGLFVLNSSSRPHVFLNGASHWLAIRPSNSTLGYAIMSFKFDTEVFEEIKLPNPFIGGDGNFLRSANIAEYRNLLSLTIKPVKDTLEIWVMKEYGVADSWVRQFSIQLPHTLYFKKWYLSNLEDENDQLLLVDKEERSLVCYNPKTKQITQDRGIALRVWQFTGLKQISVSLPGEISVDLVEF